MGDWRTGELEDKGTRDCGTGGLGNWEDWGSGELEDWGTGGLNNWKIWGFGDYGIGRL